MGIDGFWRGATAFDFASRWTANRVTFMSLLPRLSARAVSAAVAPVFVSGCMMAGMGHSTGSALRPRHEAMQSHVSSISAKVVDGDIGMTVDFRSSAAGDSVHVAVTVVGPSPMSRRDVDLTLTIVPAPVTSYSAGHEADVSAQGGAFGSMVLSPVEKGEGTYIFRPGFPRDGPYRLTVGLRRVGTRTFEPPIEVAQVWDLTPMSGARAGSSHAGDRSRLTPVLLLGGAVMAVMMLFTFR